MDIKFFENIANGDHPGSSARRSRLTLGSKIIETPIFMPVGTLGTIKGFDHAFLPRLGYDLVLANTYHLILRPGLDVLEKFGGLRAFANMDTALLTDSGGFQTFSLSPLSKFYDDGVEFRSHHDGSRHFFSPESVLEAQRIIGSDIRMILDQVVAYGSDKEEYRTALQRSNDWAKKSINYYRKELVRGKLEQSAGLALPFAILQGGFYEDLRRQGAAELIDMDFPGYAVGGLSVGEERSLFQEMAYLSASLLPANKPKYIMGVGTIQDILISIDAGFDMFDCVLPTRNARNGSFLTSLGTRNIRNAAFRMDQNPIDPNCDCHTCNRYPAAYLHHLFRNKEILAAVLATEHNLYFMRNFLDQCKTAIENGDFGSFMQEWLAFYPLNQGLRGGE